MYLTKLKCYNYVLNYRKEKNNIKIAKRDIPVWKVLLEDGVSAPIYDLKYEKGKVYKTEFQYVDKSAESPIFRRGGYKIFTKAASDFLDKNFSGWNNSNNPVRDKLICVSNGYHAFTKKKDTIVAKRGRSVVVKFIIPKGSEYIKDAVGMIVSNQIKML